MKKFLFSMIFWHDGRDNSTRLSNVNYCWPQMKKLISFLNENQINCDAKLYDFSEEKVIEDSISVPYPLSVYKRAEKMNLVIKDNLNYDFIVMFDCDMFFSSQDYDKVLDVFKSVEYRTLTTFDAAKLHTVDYDSLDDNFDPYKLDWSYAYSGSKDLGPLAHGMIGGLGGIYICDINLIKESGFFNEKFVTWGGEDGDMLDKIYYLSAEKKINPTRHFSPFHLPHFSDWSNPNYK
jgi:predicted glycosyltransferase involved in capsule biosynthesis